MSLNKQPINKMSQNNTQHQLAFDTNSRNENGIVVCIPRVFKNITKERIFACMVITNWGQIEKVDLIQGKSFNKAFVHFVPNKFNIKNSNTQQALNRMLNGEQVHFTYDVNEKHPEGWFWKIGISKSVRPKFRNQQRNPARRRRTLDLSGKNTKVKINDNDLLLRKNQNQKVLKVGDDPIMARALLNSSNSKPAIKRQYSLHPTQLY